MKDTLSQFLNAYWLRPETALWRCIDTMAMSEFRFRSPSLDFGSGDGLFSFVRAGGQLDRSFDVFRATTSLERFFEKRDVYDAFDSCVAPTVTRRPQYQIDVAFDLKENLLKKAAALGLYKSTKCGDGNATLPFEDDEFLSVFSNILYWLDDPVRTLKELRRITRLGGEIYLMLPDTRLLDYSFYNSLYKRTGCREWAWLELIDRGRLADNIKQVKSAAEWDLIFWEAGLRASYHGRHLSQAIAQIWDIGLRPLFPALMKMVHAIDADKLPDIKAEWIAIVEQFAGPLLEIERRSNPRESAFHSYVLVHR